MSLAHHFFTMACNNAWANHRLHRAIGALSADELAAPRVSFFPSLKATLNHIVTVDWLYVDALERALDDRPPEPDPGRFFEPEEPFDTAEALSHAQHAVDRRLIALGQRLDEPATRREVRIRRRDGVKVESATRVLAHLFQHQIHHRGQAHAMLAGTRVAPPPLDEFFCANEAHLRAEELAELGLSEDLVWRDG